ncbi:MAG: hypothetical protein ACR2ME_02105 [Acidimicrobiia bacterium]
MTHALLLAGGAALYLLGNVAFRIAMEIRPLSSRAFGGVAALAPIFVGVGRLGWVATGFVATRLRRHAHLGDARRSRSYIEVRSISSN